MGRVLKNAAQNYIKPRFLKTGLKDKSPAALMETKMELINDFLWVEDKPQDNSKFINDQPTADIVYLNNQLLGLMPLNFIV